MEWLEKGKCQTHPEPEQVSAGHAPRLLAAKNGTGGWKGPWVVVDFLFPCSAQQLGFGWDFSITLLHPIRLGAGHAPSQRCSSGILGTSRNWRDRLDVQLTGSRSLSQFVCLSTGLDRPQCEVHVCMVREHFPPSPALCSGCLQRRQKIPCAQGCGPGMPSAPALTPSLLPCTRIATDE